MELQGPDARAIPGYTLEDCVPIETDGVDIPVTWRTGPRIDAGELGRIRLRITMERAALYSWSTAGV